MLLTIAMEDSEVETTHTLEGNAGGTPHAIGAQGDEAVAERVAMDCDGA
jgi:hypothetical protein